LSSEDGGGKATLLSAVLLSAILTGIAIVGHEPPVPKPANAPPSEFSASRARELLGRLLGDGAPHPVGSEANSHVRERIVGELQRLGYAPAVETAFACGRAGYCAMVRNVVAALPGRQAGKAVLLCAHYDSVGAGPGASDDGMGVAALLEIARIVKAEPARENPVLFLFDEGEEAGLIGAEAFFRTEPGRRPIGVVVNLENRGTSGTSYLFETSTGNRWLVDVAARALARPVTSSLFYTVYKFLPNDTNLTVFRAHGLAGVNFAAVGGVTRYHTSRDDLAHASLSTLQHHGDNALAMARALAGADLSKPPAGDAVFFDLFGAGIIRWPESAALPLAVSTLVLLVTALALRRRDERASPASVLLGLAAAAAMPLLSGGAGFAVPFVLRRIGALPAPWIANPFWMRAAVWCLAPLGAWLIVSWLARRAGSAGLWAGVWILWAILAVVLARRLPGLSFLFFVPAAVAAVSGTLTGLARRSLLLQGFSIVAPACAAALFWLPVAWFLDTALGSPFGSVATAASVGLWAASVAPAFAAVSRNGRRRVLAALSVGALVALAAAALARPFSAESPERMSIAFSQDADTQRSRWLVYAESGRLRGEMVRAARFSVGPVRAFPWSGGPGAFAADAPGSSLPDPSAAILEDSRDGFTRRIRLNLRSPRGAPAVFLAISPASPIRSVRVAGEALAPINPRIVSYQGGWRVVTCLTTPPEGVEFAIEAGPGSFEIYAGDRSSGLPTGGTPLLRARGPEAAPSNQGDVTIVVGKLKL
jgi:peptidase M28-like protein